MGDDIISYISLFVQYDFRGVLDDCLQSALDLVDENISGEEKHGNDYGHLSDYVERSEKGERMERSERELAVMSSISLLDGILGTPEKTGMDWFCELVTSRRNDFGMTGDDRYPYVDVSVLEIDSDCIVGR